MSAYGVRLIARVHRAMLGFLLLGLATGCGGTAPKRPPVLVTLRHEAAESIDPEVTARWLLAELIEPGGDAARAISARKRLEALGARSMMSFFARGLDDTLHGHSATAADHFLSAIRSARTSPDERAPMVAWFAAHQAVRLKQETNGLWARWKPFVEGALADPGSIGWRARGELVEWSLTEAWEAAESEIDERAVELFGCLTEARLAGPFGRGAAADAYRVHPPELPGPWPARWTQSTSTERRARIREISRGGCALETDAPTPRGIYYVESFFDLPADREVIVAVQGAVAVRVDDVLVLDRDIRKWGVWPRFGAQLRLARGRHRIVARLGEPSTSIRIMRPDGVPLEVKSSADPLPPYGLTPPKVIGDPNLLMRYVKNERVVGPKNGLTRFLAAYLAHIDTADDVADVLLEPLLKDLSAATAPVLSMAAVYAKGDPVFEETQSSDLARQLFERAVEKDARLWAPALSLALGEANKKGLADAVRSVEALAKRFPGVSAVRLALARLYGELGWSPEHARTIKQLANDFPNDLSSLHAAVEVYDAEGNYTAADGLVERIQRLDRDSEIALSRALARRNYVVALAELRRLKERRPERDELSERIYDVMVRAGNTQDTWKKLSAAVKAEPLDEQARLELADAAFARGTPNSLATALAEAAESGADTTALSRAIDVVEGATALEPFRMDPKPIIEAYEASGRDMPGTAARVLDYAALWVRSDGSSRMLEHELIRIQSSEAIEQFAEHRRLEGLVLRMRVIKRDGTTLEPEEVPGKPTVTFPHLEVGDYIETEQVVFSDGDGIGAQYLGPRWFFREEKIAYARSEFVVISPSNKDLIVETTGKVPPPATTRAPGTIVRRWRVDFSPAAPSEPNSAPVTEFLPSVRIGWGITLSKRLESLTDAVAVATPVDPRIVRIAERIVEPLSARDEIGRAQSLYRWILDNVEEGDESDGRRVIIGKHGNRWRGFLMLCRALDIDAGYAVAKSRLASPPVGPISEAAQFSQPVVEVTPSNAKPRWVTLNDKYAPFGYVPAEIRGMPAYRLNHDESKLVKLPAEGGADSLVFEGTGRLDDKGSLELDLSERFSGKLAMALRNGLSQLPERQVRDALESNLIGKTLRGARLEKYEIVKRDALDEPLVVRMHVRVDRFARPQGDGLVVAPPFSLELSRATTLPSRQTPLLFTDTIHREVNVQIALPKNATARVPPKKTIRHGGQSLTRNDTASDGAVHFRRTLHVPAGRIQPGEYAAFARFAAQADAAQAAPVIVTQRNTL